MTHRLLQAMRDIYIIYIVMIIYTSMTTRPFELFLKLSGKIRGKIRLRANQGTKFKESPANQAIFFSRLHTGIDKTIGTVWGTDTHVIAALFSIFFCPMYFTMLKAVVFF